MVFPVPVAQPGEVGVPPVGPPGLLPFRFMKYICEAPARVPDATALSMMIPPVAQQPGPVVSVMFKPLPRPPDWVGIAGVLTFAATTHPFPAESTGQAAELAILTKR